MIDRLTISCTNPLSQVGGRGAGRAGWGGRLDEVEGGLLPVSCFDLLQMVIVLVGPESDHLSLTDSPLVDLIDVTLACEDADSKLVVTVADVDDEDHVGNSLLQNWKLRFSHKAKLLFKPQLPNLQQTVANTIFIINISN